MKIQLPKMPAMLVASTLAIVGLVVFQLTWMRYSRQLSEEIFNQRARMALCSAVEDYSGGVLCSGSGSTAMGCGNANTSVCGVALPLDLAGDSAFGAGLRRSLDFYQIPLDYQLSVSDQSLSSCSGSRYQSAISLPSDGGEKKAYIQMQFPDKHSFVLGKMSFMVLATVLILLFTTAVLLYANWSLLKQKRLLQTNVDFFNNMAHEFRTPLANMALATNMFSKKHPEWRSDQFLDIIRRENAKLLAQIERVLHLARLENGDYVLQKERLPLRGLLQSVADEMSMQIRERGAKVTLASIPDQVEVFGDRLHLSNVFRNLLDNALKYCGEHPEISIVAQEQASGILISVQDNGIGIPSDQCGLIFEKFQRVSQGDLHQQKGFGLGLAYVKSMIELHKGSVRVSSEVNRGSRFDVFLPANVA